MMLNGGALNSAQVNGAYGLPSIYDWSALAPLERRTVYVFEVGGLVVPVSSAQAVMRLNGQSFLQVVVPDGDSWVDAIASSLNAPMTLRKGYRYADGSLSPLEPIAAATFQTLRSDEGGGSHSVTLSGYAPYEQAATSRRRLDGVSYRSIGTDGRRRVRCHIDLFLQPGHTAIDTDGVEFTVGTIQYFINSRNDWMEVMQDG